MVVQHNISAMTANRYYGVNNKGLASSLEKLASGYAINKAGDNAAGLAVSEKMRAQIGGLTQASKNAEDGISMVQTFEGALQETDSILQRMRTLAVQSANGSYQDDVDRDAIQLEFDQLNDELNQIADTDYNGTVMLNGGTMADGVHAVGGKIDYADKKTQVTDATLKALQKQQENAATALSTAKANYKSGRFDLSSNGEAPEWNTVDNSKYGKDDADELWATLGFKTGNKADTSQADTVNLTMEFDGTNWFVKSAVSTLNGEQVGKTEYADKTASDAVFTITPSASPATGASGKGGFDIKLTNAVGSLTDQGGTAMTYTPAAGDLGNVIFDNTQVTKGSTITLTYKNGDTSKIAPTNVGFNESTYVKDVTDGTIADMTVANNMTDANMTEANEKALTALEDAQISVSYHKQASGFEAGDITVNGKAIKIGTAGTDEGTALVDSEGNTVYAIASTAGVITFSSTAKSTDATKLVTVTADASAGSKAGTVSGKISMDKHAYSAGQTYSLSVGDNPDLESSAKESAAIDKAQADLDAIGKKLTEFKTLDAEKASDWEKIKSMYAEAMSSSGNKVSVSDNFDNSTAVLTYTDSMDLQVGARSKDIVEFTMAYSSKGLGDLESNLNCSSREGGLETAKLSLRTSKDANAAIDKIDNAINKVNMVRATFGAVQNRLEHKINNIDTNTENLTAAESRIRDTQMDKEMMKFTSSQILSQASQSMLAQANQLPQGVLQLLG